MGLTVLEWVAVAWSIVGTAIVAFVLGYDCGERKASKDKLP